MPNAKLLPTLQIALLGLLIAAFGGQAPASDPATKPAAEPDWGKEIEGFKLAASIDRAQFDGIEGIVIHVRLGSTSANEVRLFSGPWGGCSCRVTFDGKPCAKTSYGSMLEAADNSAYGPQLRIIKVAAGADFNFDLPCSRFADMTRPGKYTIVIERPMRLADGKTWKTLESKPLEVEVADAPGP